MSFLKQRLLLAPLCPLNLKGDTVESEMCGAVFASTLANFVQKNFRQKFSKIYHFLDLMTSWEQTIKNFIVFRPFTQIV